MVQTNGKYKMKYKFTYSLFFPDSSADHEPSFVRSGFCFVRFWMSPASEGV
jgi:hypothetical protein